MPAKTQAHADDILNILRGLTPSIPSTVYVALFSTAPTHDNDPGTELAGNGYARQSVSFSAPSDASETDVRQIVNSAVVTFGPAVSANWLQAVAWGLFYASTGGSLKYYAALTVPKTIEVSDEARFSAGDLKVKEG